MSNNITPIFGRLKNVTKENPYVAGAIDIKDDIKNKNQQAINQETDEHLGVHDTEIADRYTKEEVNNIVSRTPETDVIVIDVPAASQSDIAGWLDANTPSGIDPETGRSVRANKLYRVPGPDNTTFSEWAWDGTKYIMLANKDYGIDNYPIKDSQNLTKSGTNFEINKFVGKHILYDNDKIEENLSNADADVPGLLTKTGTLDTNPSIISTGYKTSPYIEIPENVGGVKFTHLFPVTLTNSWSGLCIYDDNYNFISNVQDFERPASDYMDGVCNFSNYPNAKYIRFSPSLAGNCLLVWRKDINALKRKIESIPISLRGNYDDYINAYKWLEKLKVSVIGENIGGVTVDLETRSISLNVGQINNTGYIGVELSNNRERYKQLFSEDEHTVYYIVERVGDDIDISGKVKNNCVRGFCLLEKNNVQTKYDGNVSKIGENKFIISVQIPKDNYDKVYVDLQADPNGIEVSTTTTFTITDIRVSNIEPLILSFDSLINGYNIPLVDCTAREISRLIEFDDSLSDDFKVICCLKVDSVTGTALYGLNAFIADKNEMIDGTLFNLASTASHNFRELVKELTFDVSDIKDARFICTNAAENITKWSGSFSVRIKNVKTFNDYDVKMFKQSYKLITRNVQNAVHGVLNYAGEVTDVEGYYTSDFIKVNNNTRLYGFGLMPMDDWNGICLYDSNKDFIAGIPYNNQTINKIEGADDRLIDTDLKQYPNVCYIRFSSFYTETNGSSRLYISTPGDEIIDYTSVDKYYADIIGFINTNGSPKENTMGNYRTPLVRVKPGEFVVFTGSYSNYATLPAVVGYSDDNYSNPQPLFKKNGRHTDVAVKIPSGVKYIVGWGERGLADGGTMNSINTPCYIGRKYSNITVIVGEGGSTTSLLEGILMATEGFDNTVIVEAGTYNLISEFENYYGQNFFSSYNNNIKGIYLKNRVKVIFSDGANVVCDYTGNNTDVQQQFSPFNADKYGFTIDNLHLRCSRVRYCIHDERGVTTDSYENIYKNCDLYIDNTNNAVWHSSNTIGGGLGKHGNVKVLNCILETVDPYVYANFGTISYHNSRQDNAQSTIVVSGNYLKGETGRFRLSWYGESHLITKAIVTNNSMGGSIVHRAETGDYDIRNTELIEWNNIIR